MGKKSEVERKDVGGQVIQEPVGRKLVEFAELREGEVRSAP